MVRYAAVVLAGLLRGWTARPAAAEGNVAPQVGLRASLATSKSTDEAEGSPWWRDARKLQAPSCPSPDPTNFFVQVRPSSRHGA